MSQNNTQSKPTVQVATYRLLDQLRKEMGPIAKLVAPSEAPDQPPPMEAVIELLKALTGGVEQIRVRLETLESRLDEAAVTKALKDAVHN